MYLGTAVIDATLFRVARKRTATPEAVLSLAI